jgi:hypothetical protein
MEYQQEMSSTKSGNSSSVKCLNRCRVNVNGLIIQVLQGDFSIILELGPDVPEIDADGIQIQQVLVNSISNAIDSVNTPGISNRTLIVRARLSKEEVVVDVEDSGIGISDPSRIFEAFFTTKEKGMASDLQSAS